MSVGLSSLWNLLWRIFSLPLSLLWPCLPHSHLCSGCTWPPLSVSSLPPSPSNRTLWQAWISCKWLVTRSFIFSSARLHKVILTGVSSGMGMWVSLGAHFLVYRRLFRVLGEGNGNPLQYSCLENPMDGGAWRAAAHGVAKSRTGQRDFTFTLGLVFDSVSFHDIQFYLNYYYCLNAAPKTLHPPPKKFPVDA